MKMRTTYAARSESISDGKNDGTEWVNNHPIGECLQRFHASTLQISNGPQPKRYNESILLNLSAIATHKKYSFFADHHDRKLLLLVGWQVCSHPMLLSGSLHARVNVGTSSFSSTIFDAMAQWRGKKMRMKWKKWYGGKWDIRDDRLLHWILQTPHAIWMHWKRQRLKK